MNGFEKCLVPVVMSDILAGPESPYRWAKRSKNHYEKGCHLIYSRVVKLESGLWQTELILSLGGGREIDLAGWYCDDAGCDVVHHHKYRTEQDAKSALNLLVKRHREHLDVLEVAV